VLRLDRLATGTYYRSPAPGQPVIVPASAQQLTQAVVSYATASTVPTQPLPPITTPYPIESANTSAPDPSTVQQHRASEADVLRGQLIQIAPKLYQLLDPQWKSYLALPSSMFLGGDHPRPQQLAATVERFESVSRDPRFRQLAARPEFQSVLGMLKHYQQSLAATPSTLQLPPPPATDSGSQPR
jgi:hypothetical protein